MDIENGIVAVLKKDCPTCVLVVPVLQDIELSGVKLTAYVQDDPSFARVDRVVDDRELENSHRFKIETVPTLIRIESGQEVGRVIGWHRAEWEELVGAKGLGATLPESRPGCGSKSVEPGVAERLELRFGDNPITARRIKVPELSDDIETCYEKDWTDGLPVVPPTEERVYRMLQGSSWEAAEVLGKMPPFNISATVEKVAINAVMAGCKPEFFPVVLTAVKAALDPGFCLHGLLATTWFSGTLCIVNGPVREAIGMNWQGNVLGQGNRANATIGRALQLAIRNIGGGKPRETDQSAFGSPAKVGFCFAEDEATEWTTLAEDKGISRERSAVTLFSADGPIGVVDQKSREPKGLISSLAGSLKAVNHVEMANAADVVIVVGPEHGRVFETAGWSKTDVVRALHEASHIEGTDLGMGTAAKSNKAQHAGYLPKFREGGLTLVRAGGDAGLFSAIIPGWIMKGPLGTEPITKEVAL